jgi:hypothetical protein
MSCAVKYKENHEPMSSETGSDHGKSFQFNRKRITDSLEIA